MILYISHFINQKQINSKTILVLTKFMIFHNAWTLLDMLQHSHTIISTCTKILIFSWHYYTSDIHPVHFINTFQ